ncbi:MAG: glycerophosphodiester phosphodiesterase family protein [Roseinatronobacter sp.]
MPDLPEPFLTRPIAHRGLHGGGLVENSLSAIDAAIAGDYGIEIDIQESADGVAMVFHDDTLERLTVAEGPVRAQTAEALGKLTLGGTTDHIPRLSEVLTRVAGRVPLLIEIKDQSLTLGALSGSLEAAVARELAGYSGPVAVMSFNPGSMAHMARLAPQVPRGLVTCDFAPDDWDGVPQARLQDLKTIPDVAKVGASFISHDWADLDRPRVQDLRDQGLTILCWTIRNADQERQVRAVAANITFEGYTPTA